MSVANFLIHTQNQTSISRTFKHIPLSLTPIPLPPRYPPTKKPGVGLAQYRLAKAMGAMETLSHGIVLGHEGNAPSKPSGVSERYTSDRDESPAKQGARH